MYARVILCALGFTTMYYEKVVDERLTQAKELGDDYEPSCNIGLGSFGSLSCSSILESKWARGFGFLEQILGEDSDLIQPNYHYGMIHYALSGLFGIFWPKMARICSLGGIGALLFFSYAMYDIGALCIACIIGHIVNILLFYIDFTQSKSKKIKSE